jgi:hypothetical protein
VEREHYVQKTDLQECQNNSSRCFIEKEGENVKEINQMATALAFLCYETLGGMSIETHTNTKRNYYIPCMGKRSGSCKIYLQGAEGTLNCISSEFL